MVARHGTIEQAGGRLPGGACLRPLIEADATALASLAARLGQSGDEAYWRRQIEQSGREAGACLGIEVDGQIVAYLLGHVRGGEFGLADETGWLELLGVDPAWQGRGLARALAEAALEQFAARGVRRVLTLVSGHDDTLRPFFRSLGFRPSPFVCLERRL